ncbi:MAG: hypothetical protein QY326_07255 [Bdellovibrionota bacterium]|nr:MAG: hypothetical protein QY326_07255 [Bdellovibrionota bacterium]
MYTPTSRAIAASFALTLGGTTFSQQAVDPRGVDLELQSITNPARPFTPFDRKEIDREVYRLRWAREIGANKEEYFLMRAAF